MNMEIFHVYGDFVHVYGGFFFHVYGEFVNVYGGFVSMYMEIYFHVYGVLMPCIWRQYFISGWSFQSLA